MSSLVPAKTVRKTEYELLEEITDHKSLFTDRLCCRVRSDTLISCYNIDEGFSFCILGLWILDWSRGCGHFRRLHFDPS